MHKVILHINYLTFIIYIFYYYVTLIIFLYFYIRIIKQQIIIIKIFYTKTTKIGQIKYLY